LDIRTGQPWDREIQKALIKANSILIILSPSSVDSDNVLNEIYYGMDKGKQIVPIKINECDVPIRLYRLHYIDFSIDYSIALNQLIHTLDAKHL